MAEGTALGIALLLGVAASSAWITAIIVGANQYEKGVLKGKDEARDALYSAFVAEVDVPHVAEANPEILAFWSRTLSALGVTPPGYLVEAISMKLTDIKALPSGEDA